MSDTRPVWLTREQRDAMDGASKRWPLLWDVVDAWDAAPADPAEAVLSALEKRGDHYQPYALEILAALGYPAARDATTTTTP